MPREYADKSPPLTPEQQKPHLALLGAENKMLAIPPGAVLVYVEDNKRVDGVFPWRILSVGRRQWKFKCPCGRPGCTREAVATFKYTGQHTGEGVVTK